MGSLHQNLVLQIKFKPGLAGQFHLREQKQALIRHKVGNLPEIKSISDTEIGSVPAAPV
jgi:hypothetical protein